MNETTENSIDINTVIDEMDNTISDEINNDLSLTAVYDDYYYQNVLKSLNTISSNQNITLKNDEELINQVKNTNSSFNVLIFLIGFIFIYIYLRNMIKRG